MKIEKLQTDVLIIGGGTAGCYGAITIAENSNKSVIVLDKANIKRSGCLAAGVNALNAYIVKGRKPQDYVDYAKQDAEEIVREDLLLTMSENLNKVTKRLEDFGLVILKDENGEYVARGNRNIKINGENIKPLLANEVTKHLNINVLNGVNAIEYIVEDNEIVGAYAASVHEDIFYVIEAKAVICATGGAAGLYKPNNPGFSRHKMWYSPFNTGAGFAMGIKAGAEMTTFEMRFIALRCKDTISPTGTLAQGVGAEQVNALGEEYQYKYGNTTAQRVYGTVKETLEGRGPCYLKTEGITKKQDEDLMKAYLNMSPSQTLKWIENGKGPSEDNVEIEGTEPYIVGGHTASGYWVDTDRSTTIKGLYAAGDVAGGCPQKYVTGALVEGEIAALAALNYIDGKENKEIKEEVIKDKVNYINKFLNNEKDLFGIDDLEEAMQKVMDTYAGGIGSHYQYNETQLNLAEEKIENLESLSENLKAEDMYELMKVFELKERLTVCKTVIAHLRARKETRWHSFGENLDYPEKDDDKWLKYVNSKFEDGKVKIIFRDLINGGDKYEH
ncbi:adenylylsulfate reductase subunit A [Clostridium saccharoperbutylacetonicum]|uniref:Succinate dehydrogenase/fumarate reductase flavoprotein subunit n=1 Tax=Clostridium saccharoperbutylacetonicum N1-4(HMT) TaxID=931276 RepID=M1LUK3_9CLOT|nr:adenylyl-sulfate reductase subunit alpha [Clostridium saccharoperbutylacetonicum]AGF56735.1 succinate dehydrogenase/fumarate reductase flavoprotein subunit [Clostridium saccharoperbutylacetonicum N1-4(HMT)]NRT62510.1 adenylylsulfate reductase subunit A [Clostridium saccharoperbutylacetonicum]NSB25857.1 adenylylsulfate reductase subunit A [Clostridium saccharoperbutylacetonicum]NSB45216.1 adenylylsulfate reductase subunit A [Clostridium saccharoperbutylacetonicum]